MTTILGELQNRDGIGVVRLSDRYDTDAQDLWSAITTPARLARWIGEVSGDLQVGGAFHVRFTSTAEGPGRIDVCDPPHRLLLTMSPGDPDQTEIEALLTEDGDGTLLVVEERGLPVDRLPDHGAGWQAHLEDLAATLAGREPGSWLGRWEQLIPSYRALA